MRGNYLYKKIGYKIYFERQKVCKSQEHLAQDAQIDRTYLARIEQGRANPSLKTLYKIAKSMKVSMKKFF